jgi:hypothetical protein
MTKSDSCKTGIKHLAAFFSSNTAPPLTALWRFNRSAGTKVILGRLVHGHSSARAGHSWDESIPNANPPFDSRWQPRLPRLLWIHTLASVLHMSSYLRYQYFLNPFEMPEYVDVSACFHLIPRLSYALLGEKFFICSLGADDEIPIL